MFFGLTLFWESNAQMPSRTPFSTTQTFVQVGEGRSNVCSLIARSKESDARGCCRPVLQYCRSITTACKSAPASDRFGARAGVAAKSPGRSRACNSWLNEGRNVPYRSPLAPMDRDESLSLRRLALASFLFGNSVEAWPVSGSAANRVPLQSHRPWSRDRDEPSSGSEDAK
jgi:hypothetical protein